MLCSWSCILLKAKLVSLDLEAIAEEVGTGKVG